FVVHVQLDFCLPLVGWLENHSAVNISAAFTLPGEHLVWHLARDTGIPFLTLPANFGPPVKALIGLLLHRLNAFHEAREFLELGPLVVNRTHRSINDYFFVH